MLSILLSIPEVRTLHLILGLNAVAAVSTAVVCLKFFLLCLEVREKKRHLTPDYQNLPAETISWVFNRSLFLWLNSLFWSGFHRPVTSTELGSIDAQLLSATIHGRVKEEWERQQLNCSAPFRRSCIEPIPARLGYGALLFAQPFLIQRAIDFLRAPATRIRADIGYGFIGATALIYIGIAVSLPFLLKLRKWKTYHSSKPDLNYMVQASTLPQHRHCSWGACVNHLY